VQPSLTEPQFLPAHAVAMLIGVHTHWPEPLQVVLGGVVHEPQL
jgi:hypothetical protein